MFVLEELIPGFMPYFHAIILSNHAHNHTTCYNNEMYVCENNKTAYRAGQGCINRAHFVMTRPQKRVLDDRYCFI